MPQLSAIDTVTIALEHTKEQLFRPFRWGQWLRLALLGLATGELSTSGGCNGSNFNVPAIPRGQTGGDSGQTFLSTLPHWDPNRIGAMLGLLGLVLLLVGVLVLVMMYVRAVGRFMLIETIIRKKCSLREGWHKWQKPGRRFFLWELVYQFAVGMFAVILIGIPVGIALLLGWFKSPKDHLLPFILGGILLFFLFMIFMFSALLVYVLAKDFVAPIMALEGLDFADGWSRLFGMMKSEKGAYAGYVGMKIVLAIAAGVLFGIIGFIILLIFLLPVGGLGVIAVLAGKAAGLAWNLWTITLAVVVGSLVLLVLMFLMALVSVPVTIFFPAYSIHFFAARYPALAAWLHPAPPPPSAPPPIPPVLPPITPEPIG